ncbi:dual specificity protein phosphatase 3-like [Littorina saxatilis]|uniref:Dual specificity protein phosphatase n=1 Tax=Littorina saxatilis TaxID=31220 RepID=A0AAN9G8K9_9CAEN
MATEKKGQLEGKAPCTIEELEAIITAQTGGLFLEPSAAYDEILPGLYLGDGETAQKRVLLRDLGVTHVLNAALGKSNFHVNTNHDMYRKRNMSFLGVEATDFMNFNMTPFFQQAAAFIEEGLHSGKVLVHCVQGMSRAATLTIAYLMLKRHMTLQDATRLVREKREICPNQGFLLQLCKLDQSLRTAGHYQSEHVS